ncbi:MAG: sigma-70 family RNA polymerase sigma factor [Gemmataceae bacterium]
MSDTSFPALMARLRAGHDDAAARVFQQYARRLMALARIHLDGALRQKVDPEDVMQSAFRSFFHHQVDRGYEPDNWDGLWRLLALITVRKCYDRHEHFRAACRDVGREVPRSPGHDPGADDSAMSWQALTREPSPSEAAMLAETVQGLMRELSARDREILTLSLQGFGPPEISSQVGCTERTVYRVLEHIRDLLEKRQAEGSEA